MDDLTNRVERALLGALITDLGQAQRVEYVEPRDFANALHRVTYTAVRSLRRAAGPPTTDRSAAIARAASPHVSEAYVRGLAASCPDPSHASAYGVRVVQAALYRQMAQSAEALGAQAAVLGYAGARAAQIGADRGRQALDAAHHLKLVSTALRHHAAALAPTRPSLASVSELRQLGPPGDQGYESGLARRQVQREEHVLAALLQQHPESDQILAILPAAAFTNSDRQEIVRAIRRLRQASQPIDELTVRWELQIGRDLSGQMHGNSDLGLGASTSVMRLARAAATAESPFRTARELLGQLDNRTAPDRRSERQTRPSQVSPSATAAPPATQMPLAIDQQGQEPRT